jgi:hypothetical protein
VEIDKFGPLGKILRPAGYAVAVGAGIVSLVGVIVGFNKLKGWWEKKQLGKKKKQLQGSNQQKRRRRHVRDWTVRVE